MLKLSHHDKTLHYGFCTELMVITPRPPPRSYWIFICSGRESLWSSLYPKNRNNNSFKIAYLQISVKEVEEIRKVLCEVSTDVTSNI